MSSDLRIHSVFFFFSRQVAILDQTSVGIAGVTKINAKPVCKDILPAPPPPPPPPPNKLRCEKIILWSLKERPPNKSSTVENISISQ